MSTRSFGSLGAASAVGITAGAAATALILRRLLLRTRLPRLRAHYCVTNLDEQRRRILEEAAPNVDITFGLEVGALKKHADPVVVVLPGAAGPQMELACATLPGLKHIIVPYAGILPPQLERLRGAFGDRLDTTVTLHNLHHNAPMTAEMGVALLLAAAKRIVPADRRLRAGDWRPRGLPFDGAVVEPPMPMLLLEGRCALVLGLGNLGGRIAKVLLALGMRVVGTRRSARRKRMVDGVEVHPTSGLAALLPRADVLMVCVPSTAETQRMIGRRELEMLPQGAIVVNVGRGDVIEEAPLYEALRSGRLHGAGVDVWYNYPKDYEAAACTPPSALPFDALDSVVLSPHRGGGIGIQDTELLRLRHIGEMLGEAAKGRPMPNRWSFAKGY